MKNALHIIAIIAAVMLPAVAGAQIDYNNALIEGKTQFSFKQYTPSILAFNNAIAARPYDPEPYILTSYVKFIINDYAGAERYADKAIELHPWKEDAWELRSLARMKLGSLRPGKYEEALTDLDHLISRSEEELQDPEGPLYNKSAVLFNLKRYAEADTTLATLLQRHPNNSDAWLLRAAASIAAADTAACVAYVDSVIKLRPKSFNAHMMRAQLALQYEDDKKRCIAELDSAISIKPDDASLYVSRANVKYHTNNLMGAMDDYSKALHIDPDNEIALYNRTLLRTEVRDLDNAVHDYTRLIEKDPDNDLALYQRAMIYAEKGEYRKAVNDMTRFIEMYPTLATAYFIRSQWNLAAGDRARARADYDKGRQLASANRPIKKQVRKKSKIELSFESIGKQEEETETEELTPDEFERRLNTVVEADNKLDDLRYDDSNIREHMPYADFEPEIEPMMQITLLNTTADRYKRNYNIEGLEQITNMGLLPPVGIMANNTPTIDIDELARLTDLIYALDSSIAQSQSTADYLCRAIVLMSLHRNQEALIDIERIIEKNPDDALGYMMRAQAKYFAAKDTNPTPAAETLLDIMADLDKAKDRSTTYKDVIWYNKGNIAFELGQYDRAVDYYTRAIESRKQFMRPGNSDFKNPAPTDMGEAYYNRGYAYIKLNKVEDALQDFSNANTCGIGKTEIIFARTTKSK